MAKTASTNVRKGAKKLYRCIAVNSIMSVTREYSRQFGPGAIVALDEPIDELGRDTLRDLGVRESCWEPVDMRPAVSSEEEK